jgi:glutamine amidotransferase
VTVLIAIDTGNLGSVASALRHLGADFRVSSDPDVVGSAERLILPGVGAFDAAMGTLRARGLVGPILEAVRGRRAPILGVCLGMQLLLEASEEGGLPGLSLLPGRAVRLGRDDVKVPHVGFAEVAFPASSRLAVGLPEGSSFYFTHSYALRGSMEDAACGTVAYDGGFVASIELGPVHGVQFHPEKSHGAGLRLLANFLLIPPLAA